MDIKKEELIMLAMLFFAKIVNGDRKFSETPKTLQEQVKKLLIENQLESLID